MSFSTLIGNERNKKILQRLLQKGGIASTLIFAGPDGVGKRQFALTFAKAANCKNAPASSADAGFAVDSCDQCQVCRRIDDGTYGDVTEIHPDGQYIKIAQTRAMADEVYYRPREGRRKFFIINQAERLRVEAANSLLKTLEEPPPTTTIILLASRPDSLLQTIRSRAQRLNFAPLSIEEMDKYLEANFPRPQADRALVARLTGGRIGQATAFDLSLYRPQRRALIELLELLAGGENLHRLQKAAEFLGKRERDDFEKELDLMLVLLRDLFLLAAGKDKDSIVNIDIADHLEKLAEKIGLTRLIDWTERLNQIRHDLRVNVNRQLATEAALLQMIPGRRPV